MPVAVKGGDSGRSVSEGRSMTEKSNDDLKEQMAEALKRKQQGQHGVADGHHQKQKGPDERSRQGGGGLFRRKAGGGG